MRAATLCSGIGAPEAAMPHWQWLWHAETEPRAAAIHAARHRAGPNLGDIDAPDLTARAAAHGPVDVIVAGTPCQSFSIAGKRLGLDDPRGNLTLRAIRLARDLGATWLVLENVPGLLSHDRGRSFETVLRAMAAGGYMGAWRMLDAQHFGLAQRRLRLFVVGHLGDWRRATAVLLEPESLSGNPPPSRSPRENPPPGAAQAFGGNRTSGPVDLATALNAHGGPHGRLDLESETFVVRGASTQDAFCTPDGIAPTLAFAGSTHGGHHQPKIMAINHQSGGSAGRLVGAVPDLASALSHCQKQAVVAIAENQRNELRTSATIPALSHGGGKPGRGYPAISTASTIRRLTPLECERLQGFPDNFTAIACRNKPLADGPRYRALGNSMAVPVIRWILSRLETTHREPPQAP